MLKFNQALADALALKDNALDWCSTLVTMLGPNLTIRARRSNDANSTTVYDTGIEFFSADIQSPPQALGSRVFGFGQFVNASLPAAADLATGASVIRIAGNGNWIEGSLGLTNSACDFKATVSPTAKSGLALDALSIYAPLNLRSGVGPAAPELDANAPGFLDFYDHRIESTPKLFKRVALDTRIADMSYQDSEIANEIGDVRVTQCSSTVVFGSIEFGFTMYSVHGGLNLDHPGVPVHQVSGAMKPYGTWPTYPFMDTYRPDRDTTFPEAFKVKVVALDGTTVLGTMEMHDGLAINSKQLAQDWGSQQTKGLRPHVNCGMMLFWESSRLKYSSNATHWFPGVTAQSVRPSMAKQGASAVGTVPLATGREQWNSTLHYYAAPEWPLPWSQNAVPEIDAQDTFDDPYLYDVKTYHAYEGHHYRKTGWNYEPGSISVHDWYTGPGGPRHDRYALPTPLVRYFTDPTGTRLKGAVPNRTALDAYNKAYFNHAHHYFLDVKTFKIMPPEWMRDGAVAYGNAYYGNANAYVPGGPTRHVDNRAISNGGGWMLPPVRDGHINPWNGWAVDGLHSYCQPGLVTMFCNSPAHTLSGALRSFAHVMGSLAAAPPAAGTVDLQLSRNQAWRFLHHIVMWKIATSHPLGIDREIIEQRAQLEMESIYNKVYKPAILDNEQSIWAKGIRNVGQGYLVTYGNGDLSGKKWQVIGSDSKAGYFALVFILARQTGFWKAMRQRSEKCDTVLRFLMESMDKSTIDSLYYTKGQYEWRGNLSEMIPYERDGAGRDITPDPEPYADWNDYMAHNPANGLETILTDVNGDPSVVHIAATNFLRIQWAFMRRDFFPDIPRDRVTDVCDMLQPMLDNVDAKIKSIASLTSQMYADFGYVYPPAGVVKAPDFLVPI